MSIDPDIETILTLGEACRAVPPIGVSPATMARWIQRGVRGGTRLETILIGGRRLTSKAALARFFEAQNAGDSTVPSISPKQRAAQSQAARRELEKLGI